MEPSPFERLIRHQAGLVTKQDLASALAPIRSDLRTLKWMWA